jgi:hypothetical protein
MANLKMMALPLPLQEGRAYSERCALVDTLILERLKKGAFEPSAWNTRIVHLALAAEFPAEPNVFVAFYKRPMAQALPPEDRFHMHI